MKLSEVFVRYVSFAIICSWLLICKSDSISASVIEEIQEDESQEVVYLEGNEVCLGSTGNVPEISTFSLRTNSVTVVLTERVDDFNASYPYITGQIKYIQDDGLTGDSRGPDGSIRYRYAYCLNHFKDGPSNQTLSLSGYENSYVHHVIYHGAMYYGELCRDHTHSTGNWKYDYLATQMAIHVVRDEFSLTEITDSINSSYASDENKNKMIHAINQMVQDAKSQIKSVDSVYDEDGWYRMDKSSKTTFSLTKGNGEWVQGQDGYYYSDWISPRLNSEGKYYANSEISYMKTNVDKDILLDYKYPDSIHSPFRLKVKQDTYQEWKYTGKKITIKSMIRVPKRWKAATFKPSGGEVYQDLAVPVYENINDYKEYSASVQFDIPVSLIRYQLEVQKLNDYNKSIDGAEFSLYKDKKMQELLQKAVVQDGTARFTDLSSDEVYYLVETKAPAGYSDRDIPQIIFKISGAVDDNGNLTCTINGTSYSWENTDSTKDVYFTKDTMSVLHMKIINEAGMKLPETGSSDMLMISIVILICMYITFKKRGIKYVW